MKYIDKIIVQEKDAVGMSAAEVYKCQIEDQVVYLKRINEIYSRTTYSVKREAEVMQWLEGILNVPKVIEYGQKESHWIWYIFPQIRGLSHSERANYYAIEDIEEATNYLKNPILYARLIEISKALLEVEEKTAIEILGYVDAMKVKSSMTLFHLANPEEKTYIEVLNKYYQGEKDEKTIQLLQKNYQYQQNRKNII